MMSKHSLITLEVLELPANEIETVREMLANPYHTYHDVSQYLKSKGYNVSKLAIGRYAVPEIEKDMRLNAVRKSTHRLAEDIVSYMYVAKNRNKNYNAYREDQVPKLTKLCTDIVENIINDPGVGL